MCKGTSKLEARIQYYTKLKIFIPGQNRACLTHFFNKRFFEDDLRLIIVYSNSSFLTIDEISLLINRFIFDFLKLKSCELSEEQIQTFTSLSYENLKQLLNMLVFITNSECRYKLQTLVIFLSKLGTGWTLSIDLLSTFVKTPL